MSEPRLTRIRREMVNSGAEVRSIYTAEFDDGTVLAGIPAEKLDDFLAARTTAEPSIVRFEGMTLGPAYGTKERSSS